MKGGCVLHQLVVMLRIYHTLTADGCGITTGVRCGDECISYHGYCTCGEGSKEFNIFDNTTWCCNGSNCEKTGHNIVCKNGTPLSLTTPCQGQCNTGKSFMAAREYWGCESKDQCIKVQYVEDGVHHCKDRSDERKRDQDLLSPIQWDKLSPCYRFGVQDLREM